MRRTGWLHGKSCLLRWRRRIFLGCLCVVKVNRRIHLAFLLCPSRGVGIRRQLLTVLQRFVRQTHRICHLYRLGAIWRFFLPAVQDRQVGRQNCLYLPNPAVQCALHRCCDITHEPLFDLGTRRRFLRLLSCLSQGLFPAAAQLIGQQDAPAHHLLRSLRLFARKARVFFLPVRLPPVSDRGRGAPADRGKRRCQPAQAFLLHRAYAPAAHRLPGLLHCGRRLCADGLAGQDFPLFALRRRLDGLYGPCGLLGYLHCRRTWLRCMTALPCGAGLWQTCVPPCGVGWRLRRG